MKVEEFKKLKEFDYENLGKRNLKIGEKFLIGSMVEQKNNRNKNEKVDICEVITVKNNSVEFIIKTITLK